MNLFFRKYGSGQPLIILHGLFGSSDNWITIAKQLSGDFEVIVPDLRNHGNSPHSSEINYDLLSEDIKELIIHNNISSPVLAGHSMGGKTVMRFAEKFPAIPKSIIMFDIAPKKYDPGNPSFIEIRYIVDIMLKTDTGSLKNLKEAELIFGDQLPDKAIVNLLLKNLKRDETGKYEWKLNIQAIDKNLVNMLDSPFSPCYNGKVNVPALFIKGANSKYILYDDFEIIHNIFPQSQVVTIPGSGHWLHAEQPGLLVDTIKMFLL